jgi:hypothetical protein
VCGPGSQLCASWRSVSRLLLGAYEFCRWISMPDGRWHSEWSSYNSQITGGVENAVLSIHRYFSQLTFVKKTQVQQSFLHWQHTIHQLSLDGFSNCVAILALDFDTPVSWARCFSDFLRVCSTLGPTAFNFSVSTRRLCFCFLPITSPKSRYSKFIHQVVNCLSARNSFLVKFTLRFSRTLSSRSLFYMGDIQKYTLL